MDVERRADRLNKVRYESHRRQQQALAIVFKEPGSPESNAAWEVYHREWSRLFRLMFGSRR